jgi:hypothetical protein
MKECCIKPALNTAISLRLIHSYHAEYTLPKTYWAVLQR